MEEIKLQDKRERITYFVIQKLMGLVIVVLSVISCIITGDGTAALLLIPIGIYTIFTRKLVITNTYYFEHGENFEWKN